MARPSGQTPDISAQRDPSANQVGTAALYDGQITGIAVTSSGTSVITTPGPHGLAVGSIVTLSFTNSTPALNGTFLVTAVSTLTFTVGTTPVQAPIIPGIQNSGGSSNLSPITVTVAGTLGIWGASIPGPVAKEYGDLNSPVRTTRLTFSNTLFTFPAAGYGSVGIYTWPFGIISIMDCVANLNFTTLTTPASTLPASTVVAWALGSAPVTSAALAMNALTNIDMLPGSGGTANQFASGLLNVPSAASTGFLNDRALTLAAIEPRFDGNSLSANPLMMYLNMATAAVITGAATIAINGFIVINHRSNGNYANL